MDTILNYKEEDLILEYVNDPSIFKAVVLAGGPGSGKSYVAKKLGLQALGMRVVNSDNYFEMLMKKFGPQNSELVQLQNQLLKPVLKLFSDACDAIGKKRQFDYILDAGTGAILYTVDANNLTEEILEEMNKMAADGQ